MTTCPKWSGNLKLPGSAECADDADPDDDFADPPALVAARKERFVVMKQMLLAQRLGVIRRGKRTPFEG